MNRELNDAHALDGATHVKVIWDINAADPVKLARTLRVVARTYDDLRDQGAQPDMVFAFRGPSVQFIGTQRGTEPAEVLEALDGIAEQLTKLMQHPGVRMEICGIAALNNGVALSAVLEGIVPVNNTFVSLIGYQRQGYALIPIS